LAFSLLLSLAFAGDPTLAAIETAPTFPAEPMVLSAGTVYTATGTVFSPGWVRLEDGRIAAVGEGTPEVPDGVRHLDYPQGAITPGIIDTHSHLGVYPSPGAKAHADGNEMVGPTTPGAWAEHGAWPQDPGFQRAVAGGITSLMLLPGSANLIGGRGVVMRPIPQRGSRAMRFPGAPETVKMACGENPKRVYGERGGPQTRMGNARVLRTRLEEARRVAQKQDAYFKEHQRWEAKPERKRGPEPKPPMVTPDDATLMGVMNGEILAQIHCYRADDMLTFMQITQEFGFSVRSFHHAIEAYKIRDILAANDVSISTWADWWGFKMEAYDGIMENAALMDEAGGRAIIHSDSAIGIQRLNQESAKAYYAALDRGIDVSEDTAIQWITRNAAWALGIDDQTGSLEVGKRADIAVWDSNPLTMTAATELVLIDGVPWWNGEVEESWSDFELGQEVK